MEQMAFQDMAMVSNFLETDSQNANFLKFENNWLSKAVLTSQL